MVQRKLIDVEAQIYNNKKKLYIIIYKYFNDH